MTDTDTNIDTDANAGASSPPHDAQHGPTRDAFDAARTAGQARLEACTHLGIKRFLTLDTQAYQDRTDKGGLDTPTKELLGLVASAVLRCDDCINYHLTRCVDEGVTIEQIEDALNVAMIVGGSIVIPHTRRALLFADQLASTHQDDA
jgi:AhpD family alkylhydroperoxidase